MKVLNHGLERPTGGLWIFADPRPHASPPPSKAEAMRVGEKLERKANAAIAHQVAVQVIAAIEPALHQRKQVPRVGPAGQTRVGDGVKERVAFGE